MNYQLYKISLLLFSCLVFLSCETTPNSQEQEIVVKVPPHPTDNLGSEEEKFWRGQKLLFPQIEIPNPIPLGLPNSHSLLLVTVEKNGEIKLNSEVIANLSTIEVLELELKRLFDMREKGGVFEPNSNKIVTATAIKANMSLKYQDVLRVILAVKSSGANPIVLQIDELPQ